jgi:hypothetical protein
MPGKRKLGDRREGNGANLRDPAKEAIKAAEPAVVHESAWIDRASVSPALRRVMDVPCWPDAELQLMAGMPVPDVARYIHETRGEAQWLRRNSLIIYLDALRRAAPILPRIAQFGARAEDLHRRWGKRAATLEVLWHNIEELEVRLERAYAREQLTGADNPEVPRMIASLVQVVGKAHEIQKDLGMVSSHTPEATGGISVELVQRVRMVAGDAAAEALMDPAAQGRVLEALRRACQAAGLPGSGLDEAMDYQYAELYGGAAPAAEDRTMAGDPLAELVAAEGEGEP